MPTLQIGQTTIPYTVRYSDRAKRQSIVVTPDAVEVIVPPGTPLNGSNSVTSFLQEKRRWLFNAVEDCQATPSPASPQRYISGAKLLYRGRRLMLQIEDADVEQVTIACKSRFYVQVPHLLMGDDRQDAIAFAFKEWMGDRTLRDAHYFANLYSRKLGVEPKGVKLANQKQTWGTCGKDRIIHIHWQLAQAPLAALEYVVAHEIVHLQHRHHDHEFWETLGTLMPDWRERKHLLESWEHCQNPKSKL